MRCISQKVRDSVMSCKQTHARLDSAGGLDTLVKLYQYGVIGFDRFSSCALRIAGMDQDTSIPQGKRCRV